MFTYWYTNLDTKRRSEEIVLYKDYNNKEFPKYDNYNAIYVSEINSIPCDYSGIMGVPITFLAKHNPNQFEIVGMTDRGDKYGVKTKTYTSSDMSNYNDINRAGALLVDGEYKAIYTQFLIKRK